MLTAVQQNGLVLPEADEDFIFDKEVLHAAVRQNWKVHLGHVFFLFFILLTSTGPKETYWKILDLFCTLVSGV